ncbi:GL21806 [Drosophila persimilis]|uniref:GL21806 n=1 Tax=Drosophila persimilis TaxID=7234 RepID=B4GEI3_DROPE|nr:uncharacterized protein LOC6592062 [Drosophila persimilis]EDW34018.1 GL21806 [Drosophila persimilis]
MEHLERYHGKASRLDSEGNRNDPPSKTIQRRIDNTEKRSSETNNTASADPKLWLGSLDSDNSLLGSPDSGSSDYSLFGSSDSDEGKCCRDSDNHDQGSSGLLCSKRDASSPIRKGSSSPDERITPEDPMAYDLSIKRNRPMDMCTTMSITPPSSESLASSDPLSTESTPVYPSSSSLEMPRQSFVGCPPLSRQPSPPPGTFVPIGMNEISEKEGRAADLKDKLKIKRVRVLVMVETEEHHKEQSKDESKNITENPKPKDTCQRCNTQSMPSAEHTSATPSSSYMTLYRVPGRSYQLTASVSQEDSSSLKGDRLTSKEDINTLTGELLKNQLMTRHLMPLKSRIPTPATPDKPVGPILYNAAGCKNRQSCSGDELELQFEPTDGQSGRPRRSVLGDLSKLPDTWTDGRFTPKSMSSQSFESIGGIDGAMSWNSGVSDMRADADSDRSSMWEGKRPARFKGQKIPREGDFRSYFELDEVSIKILWTVAYHQPTLVDLHDRILGCMERFYHHRCPVRDELIFQWYLLEGFYPIFWLLEAPLEEVIQSSDEQLDMMIHEFTYSDRISQSIPVTEDMAKYMVCAYFRVLYNYAINRKMDILSRTLLRCRFAVNVVEVFMLEQRKRPLSDSINSFELYKWSWIHEGRLKTILEEPLQTGNERATQAETQGLCIRTPNSDSFSEFYVNHQLPRPDFHAINNVSVGLRRYISKSFSETLIPCSFPCPIQGCGQDLSPSIVMSHFLTNHCRRMEEIWMGDRMICLFSPVCYPPRLNYCICMLAILDGKHKTKSHRPRYIRNLGLPTRELYFGEHLLVTVMFAKIDKSALVRETNESDEFHENELDTPRTAFSLSDAVDFHNTEYFPEIIDKKEVKVAPKPDLDDKEKTDVTSDSIYPRAGPVHFPETEPQPVDENQLYVFWLMSHDKLPRDVKVRLYVYAHERGVCGDNRNLLKPIRMSKFIDVPHMLDNHKDSCLIMDHPTMAAISSNFKDIVYVDARPVYGERYSANESSDEMWVVQP